MELCRSLARRLSALLWPLRCVACQDELDGTTILCSACRETLVSRHQRLERPSFLEPPAWQMATAEYAYGGQLAVAIHRAKYRQHGGSTARRLGTLLAHAAPAELVIPVPLHPR